MDHPSRPVEAGLSSPSAAPRRRPFGRPRLTGLWREPDFVNLWAAESVSQLGAQISLLALPLAAALSLDASAGEMGLLAAAGTLPALLVGLFAGVWVDRLRRRPLMIAADVGRAALVALVPLAWSLDALRLELLYVVAFLAGVLTVCFDIAYVSFLPAVVRRDQLIEGNSKLQASASVAQVAGPGLAGVLVGLLTAPFAISVNAVTYLLSALFLRRIGVPEPAPERHGRASLPREIAEGFGVVWRDRALRAIAASSACVSLFGYVFLAVYILYMTRDLGFSAGQVGLVLGLGGVGALLGALLAGPAARRLGVGPTIILGRLLFGVGGLLVPLAVTLRGVEVPLLVVAEFFQWLVLVMATVNELSLRQALAPTPLRGRVNATMRFAGAGMVPIGSLLGGALGEVIGLRATLVVGVAGMLVAFVFVLLSPLRTLRAAPDTDDEAPTDAAERDPAYAGWSHEP